MLGKIRAELGAVSDRAEVDRRALFFVHEPAWKPFDVQVYDEFVSVSLFCVFFLSSGPLEQAIKKFTTQRIALGNEMVASISSLFISAGLYILQQCGSTKDVKRNFEENTERSLNLKKKKARKTLL